MAGFVSAGERERAAAHAREDATHAREDLAASRSGKTELATKIGFANICRGLAALSVVLVHLAISFWLQQPAISGFTGLPPLPFSPPAFALWLNTIPVNFAAFGVALFFVVSGFVIPISLARYDARAFLLARFVRIWPTYWVGFSVTLLALGLGASAFGGERPFTPVQALIHFLPPLRPLVQSKPLDGIIWTLEIEFFWYFLAAALASPLRRGGLAVFAVPVALLALFGAIWAFTAHPPASLAKLATRFDFLVVYLPFLIFIFTGVALNFRQRGLIGRPTCALLLAFCIGLFLVTFRNEVVSQVAEARSYLLALGLFVLLMWQQERLREGRVLRALAGISYPLYVVHGFAGFVLLHALTVAGVPPLVALCLAVTLALGLAFLIHRGIEVPSHRLAQRLSRAMTRGPVRDPVTPR